MKYHFDAWLQALPVNRNKQDPSLRYLQNRWKCLCCQNQNAPKGQLLICKTCKNPCFKIYPPWVTTNKALIDRKGLAHRCSSISLAKLVSSVVKYVKQNHQQTGDSIYYLLLQLLETIKISNQHQTIGTHLRSLY